MKKVDKAQIEEILTRSVAGIFLNKKALTAALLSSKRLRIYYGIDPTGDSLHLGHLIQLRKLRQFQDLGHEVIVLIGDFTAQIGDPTDKHATRKPLTHKQVLRNAREYQKQIGRILDTKGSKVRFLHNEKWTSKLKPMDMLELASHFTVGQLLERDMFQERIKANKSIALHEFLYPIFQAYDSVTMNVDMEIGGNDQMFNMLAGRDLMRKMVGKEKFVLTTKLLVDDSGKKMGKSEGNMVELADSPAHMFGKVMSWSDKMIAPAFELLTDIPTGGIKMFAKEMKKGTNPRDIKFKLAYEIVRGYWGDAAAKKAGESFNRTFRDKKAPTRMPEVRIGVANLPLVELLRILDLASSNSDARRLIEQGGLKIDGAKITDPNASVGISDGMVVQAGKRRFVRIRK